MLGTETRCRPVAQMRTDGIIIMMGLRSGRTIGWIQMIDGWILQLGMMPALPFMIGWIELLLLGMLGTETWCRPVAQMRTNRIIIMM